MFPRMAGCLHGHLWCRTAGKERHGQGRKTDPQDLRSPMAMSVAVCIGYCDQNTCKWLQGQKWASAPPRKATDRAELCHDPAAVRSQVSMAQATMAAGNCTRCCRHSRGTASHKSIVLKGWCKTFHEVLLAMPCSMSLKNHVL